MGAKKRQVREREKQYPPEEGAEYWESYPVLGEEPDDFEPCMLTDTDPVPPDWQERMAALADEPLIQPDEAADHVSAGDRKGRAARPQRKMIAR